MERSHIKCDEDFIFFYPKFGLTVLIYINIDTMNSSEKLGKIILSMREYQKINGIKGKCVINTKYLYDTIKFSFKNAKLEVKAVIVLG